MAYRILIADDNRINREFLFGVMAGEEYQIEQAVDGQDAIDRCRGEQFDLILMDIRMPGIDGLRASQAIRRFPGYESVPIVALTADVTLQRQELEAHSFAATLAKPVSRRELLDTLAGLLGTGSAGIDGVREAPIHAESALSAAGGNRELVDRLTTMLKKEIDRFEPRIRDAISAARHPEARDMVHKLRASAGYCGATRMAKAAADLEAALADSGSSAVERAFETFAREMKALRDYLSAGRE